MLAELRDVVGPDSVQSDPATIASRLRDNSWLSPVLAGHIDAMAQASGGASLGVDAIISVASLSDLSEVVAAAYRYNSAITMLGAGTSNFGQSIPLHGGIVIELNQLNEIGTPDTQRSAITVGAGALLGRTDSVARRRNLELPVLTTTYVASSSAGWVAGGRVGLGSSQWGSIWDDNIVGATVMTCEAEPRLLNLDARTVEPVLHAYGTTGIITSVTFRLVPAQDWVEFIAAFDSFDLAARFVASLSDTTEHVRVAAAQESLLTPAFSPLSSDVSAHEALVMTIVADSEVDTTLDTVSRSGGRVIPWAGRGTSRRPTLAYMVYGHRMLWVKKVFPDAAFLHCYLGESDPVNQLLEIKARFGDHCLVEMKYIRSRWLRERWGQSGGGVIFAPLVGMTNGSDELEELMTFCDTMGVTYQNPHSFLLEDQGLCEDPAKLRRFKRRVDPKGLLNPGKLSASERLT